MRIDDSEDEISDRRETEIQTMATDKIFSS